MAGYVDPTKEAFAVFRADDRPGTIDMLNLVKLRAQAAYPDGRRADRGRCLCGVRAGERAGFLAPRGDRSSARRLRADADRPNGGALGRMLHRRVPDCRRLRRYVRDPVYREAIKHRQTGVEDSRLIRLAPGAVGVGFG